MHLPELVAYVALIDADAARRFGADRDTARHDAYAREAVLDLWLTQPGLTVSMADRLLRRVRIALGRRAVDRERKEGSGEMATGLARLPTAPGTMAPLECLAGTMVSPRQVRRRWA